MKEDRDVIIVGPERNCHRPLDAVELLRSAMHAIDSRYTEEAPLYDRKQPFLVEYVVVEIRSGLVHVVIRNQEKSGQEEDQDSTLTTGDQ